MEKPALNIFCAALSDGRLDILHGDSFRYIDHISVNRETQSIILDGEELF